MSPFSNICLSIILTIYIPTQEAIDCVQSKLCACTSDEACVLNCVGTNHCQETIFSCKESQSCTIACYADNACNDATIIMNDATSLHVICGSNPEACALSEAYMDDSTISIECNETLPYSCNQLNIISDTLNTQTPIIPLIEEVHSTTSTITTFTLVITSIVVLLYVFGIWLVAFMMIKRHNQRYKKSTMQSEEKSTETMNKSASISQKVRLQSSSFCNQKAVVIVVEDDDDTSTSSNSSVAPPPPPPLTTSMIINPNKYNVTVCESATTIYDRQQNYNDELMKSTRTVLTAVTDGTDASLYDTQNAYWQQEIGLEEIVHLGADLRVANASISETDVSLYRRQHEYLQDEVNEMEDEQETPQGTKGGLAEDQNEQIDKQSTLDVLFEDRRYSGNTEITEITDASIFLTQQKYLQEEIEEKNETVGKDDDEEKMFTPRNKTTSTGFDFE